MTKLKSILENRFKKTPSNQQQKKMQVLAQKRIEGKLSAFSGIFQSKSLSQEEQGVLHNLLQQYLPSPSTSISEDFKTLSTLSSEIREINKQSILLHGERIFQARTLLKKYRDGAFTKWLMLTYGNRQTPYNFLLYYEFYHSLPQLLKEIAERMPKPVIYKLASREGSQKKKEDIILQYQGQSKSVLLSLIQKEFPLKETDLRGPKHLENAYKNIEQGLKNLQKVQKITKKDFSKLNELRKKFEMITKELNFDDQRR